MIEQFEPFEISIVIHQYKDMGYMPVIYSKGEEVYRGEYRKDYVEAQDFAMRALAIIQVTQ